MRAQRRRCAVCGRKLGPRTPHVDHDHETGRVRGLLHGSCNRALGLLRDDPDVLESGARYLRRSRRNTAGQCGMKRCSKCGELKERAWFNRRGRDGLQPKCRACQREHYGENKATVLARQREYYIENRDERIAYQCEYREANHDVIRARRRKHRDANLAALRARDREYGKTPQGRAVRLFNSARYRETNREAIRARHREYGKTPQGRAVRLTNSARRRARRRNAIVEYIPAHVEELIRQAPCHYCGGPGGSVDHFIPLARGGAHVFDNLRPACGRCNSRKRDRLLPEQPSAAELFRNINPDAQCVTTITRRACAATGSTRKAA